MPNKAQLKLLKMQIQLQICIENHNISRHFGVSMQVFLQLKTLNELRRSECRSAYTAIINLYCRSKINFITMFSNKTPQLSFPSFRGRYNEYEHTWTALFS